MSNWSQKKNIIRKRQVKTPSKQQEELIDNIYFDIILDKNLFRHTLRVYYLYYRLFHHFFFDWVVTVTDLADV